MSEKTERVDMTKKGLLYPMPRPDAVTIRRDVACGPVLVDLYRRSDAAAGTVAPAVIFVSGYPDAGLQSFLGAKLKDWESYVGWSKLTAATGLIAITYSTNNPAADLPALLQHIRQNAASLGIDASRIGLWACSGNGPMALSLLLQDPGLRCAVLCYAFTLDLDGSTHVADTAKIYRFANPCSGKSAADLPRETALFLARAGQDQTAHLNECLDRFAAQALACNLPVTITNHPEGPHGFDLLHDSERTRDIIRQVVAFLRAHLLR